VNLLLASCSTCPHLGSQLLSAVPNSPPPLALWCRASSAQQCGSVAPSHSPTSTCVTQKDGRPASSRASLTRTGAQHNTIIAQHYCRFGEGAVLAAQQSRHPRKGHRSSRQQGDKGVAMADFDEMAEQPDLDMGGEDEVSARGGSQPALAQPCVHSNLRVRPRACPLMAVPTPPQKQPSSIHACMRRSWQGGRRRRRGEATSRSRTWRSATGAPSSSG